MLYLLSSTFILPHQSFGSWRPLVLKLLTIPLLQQFSVRLTVVDNSFIHCYFKNHPLYHKKQENLAPFIKNWYSETIARSSSLAFHWYSLFLLSSSTKATQKVLTPFVSYKSVPNSKYFVQPIPSQYFLLQYCHVQHFTKFSLLLPGTILLVLNCNIYCSSEFSYLHFLPLLFSVTLIVSEIRCYSVREANYVQQQRIYRSGFSGRKFLRLRHSSNRRFLRTNGSVFDSTPHKLQYATTSSAISLPI